MIFTLNVICSIHVSHYHLQVMPQIVATDAEFSCFEYFLLIF